MNHKTTYSPHKDVTSFMDAPNTIENNQVMQMSSHIVNIFDALFL